MPRNRQTVRQLSLIEDLAAARYGLRVDEMAARHGVTRRTIERDLEALAALGHDIDNLPDENHAGLRKRLVSKGSTAQVEVQAAELASAYAAGRALVRLAAAPVSATFTLLLRKLEQAQPRAVRVDAAALDAAQALVAQAAPLPQVKPALFNILREAILSCHKLSITYRKGGTAAPRTYIAEPYGILYGGRNYLVWRGEDGAWRKFALAHIDDAMPTGKPFTLAPDFSLESFAASGVGIMADTPMDVVLRVAAAARPKLADYAFHPSQNVEPQADGSALVTFQAGGVAELCDEVFRWGGTVRIVAPEALSSAYVGRLQAALAAETGTEETTP